MERLRRGGLVLLLLGSILVLGILFRDFVWANVVVPIAVLIALFWRLLLSVDQRLYWDLLILAGGSLAGYRLLQMVSRPEEAAPAALAAYRTIQTVAKAEEEAGGVAAYRLVQPAARPEAAPAAPEAILGSIGYWRTAVVAMGVSQWASKALREDLGQLLVAIYASRQPEARLYELREALRLRQMPLPERVYGFLFTDQAQTASLRWTQRLRRLAEAAWHWVRQHTGREKAEQYQALVETLAYMETLMEIKHDDDNFAPPAH